MIAATAIWAHRLNFDPICRMAGNYVPGLTTCPAAILP
jgi:hypothetical protein